MGIRASTLLLLPLALAGCVEAGRNASAEDRKGAPARVEVANTGTPAWTTKTAWRLEEDLRLGTAVSDSADPEQFGDIGSIATDSRGRILVLDAMAQRIRVFEPDGAFSHTIGRKGRGPGEFTFASVLTIGAGDTLTVLDDGMMRFSVFAPDGTFLENDRREIVGRGSPLQIRLRDGGYVDWLTAFPDGRLGPRVRYHPVRYAPDLEHSDTFPPIERTNPMTPGGRLLMTFGGFVVAAVDDDGGIWFADSRAYVVYRRTLEGDTTLAFALPATPPPLGEPERAYVRNRWARRPEILAGQLEALPETRSVVYGIFPDDDGHVYVFADVAGEPAGTVVDVFRDSGEYLGRMALPTPVPLTDGQPPVAHATSNYLHVVVRDDFDVPYVSRLKIVEGAR